MSDYTPTTEDVLDAMKNGWPIAEDAMNRWLEEHDKEVAKKVFDNFCGYLKYNFDDTEKFWRTHYIETYRGENK